MHGTRTGASGGRVSRSFRCVEFRRAKPETARGEHVSPYVLHRVTAPTAHSSTPARICAVGTDVQVRTPSVRRGVSRVRAKTEEKTLADLVGDRAVRRILTTRGAKPRIRGPALTVRDCVRCRRGLRMENRRACRRRVPGSARRTRRGFSLVPLHSSGRSQTRQSPCRAAYVTRVTLPRGRRAVTSADGPGSPSRQCAVGPYARGPRYFETAPAGSIFGRNLVPRPGPSPTRRAPPHHPHSRDNDRRRV